MGRTLERPAFLFRALQGIPSAAASPSRHFGQVSPHPSRNAYFLLAPQRISADYVIYELGSRRICEALSTGSLPVSDFLSALEYKAAGQKLPDDWHVLTANIRTARVSGGLFFAVAEGQRYAMRVLENRPLLYVTDGERRVLLHATSRVVRFDMGYRLTLQAYLALRLRMQRVKIPLAARENGVRQSGSDTEENSTVSAVPRRQSPRLPAGPRARSSNGGLPPWAPRQPLAPRWQTGRPVSRRAPSDSASE